MQKLLDGILYDTDKATFIAMDSYPDQVSYEYSRHVELKTRHLYRTDAGRWFFYTKVEEGTNVAIFFNKIRKTGVTRYEIEIINQQRAWDTLLNWGLTPDPNLFEHKPA